MCSTASSATTSPRMRPVPREATNSRVFAASGISGGSVGLASWAVHLTRQQPAQDAESDPARRVGHPGWIRRDLSGDLLSPSLGWLLFAEMPWLFLRAGIDQSRAVCWTRVGSVPGRWSRRRRCCSGCALRSRSGRRPGTVRRAESLAPEDVDALYAALPRAQRGRTIPLLLLNSDRVSRVVVASTARCSMPTRAMSRPTTRCHSPTHLTAPREGVLGATVDLVDFCVTTRICALSTIALLSARFPFMSPAGHLAVGRPGAAWRTAA